MILRRSFYDAPNTDRAAERLKHGLDTNTPVGVVLFSWHGSSAMKRVAANAGDTPRILMCGNYAALANALRGMKANAPRIVVEFTLDLAYWMRLTDFTNGKPGPGNPSKSVHIGPPVAITRTAWTMPQDRLNTECMTQNGLELEQ